MVVRQCDSQIPKSKLMQDYWTSTSPCKFDLDTDKLAVSIGRLVGEPTIAISSSESDAEHFRLKNLQWWHRSEGHQDYQH